MSTAENFPPRVIAVAKHLGLQIYDCVGGSSKMEKYEELFNDCWCSMTSQEQQELYSDNKEEIECACLRTKLIYTIGENVFKLFSPLKVTKSYKPKYFLLSKNPYDLAELVVDNIYDKLYGSSTEDNFGNYLENFFTSLTPDQLRSVYQYEKTSPGKSCLKTKFMGHIGQQVLKWLYPKYITTTAL